MADVSYEEAFIKSAQGLTLFTCRWTPCKPVKALIFLLHAYGMECSCYMKGCGSRLARAGYAVFGIDYEGHGRSKGPRCYIKKFETIVDDCEQYFKSICEREQFRGMRRFLYGESMGAAVIIFLHRRDPTYWNGGVLVAPMCKLSKEVLPSKTTFIILESIADLLPKWKIVPTKDIIDSAYKDPAKREEIRNNKLIYQEKPRLKTGLELARTASFLEERLHEVTLPFIVLHGEEDTVVDPEVSRILYERASSNDKSIKLYPDMWHALTEGEPDNNVDIIFSDVISWLDARGPKSAPPANQTKTLVKEDSPSPERQHNIENKRKDWTFMARESPPYACTQQNM